MMLLITAFFLVSVFQLFVMRFERGDIYPPYSSLRSDPLGTKALYESLNNLKGISASRNFSPFHKLQYDSAFSLFYLGAYAESDLFFRKTSMESLESMLSGGGQFIISFVPERSRQPEDNQKKEEIETDDEDSDRSSGSGEKENDENDPHESPFKFVDLGEHWGFELENRKLSCGSDCREKAAGILISDNYDLPDSIQWHSAFYFASLDTSWNIIYAVDGLPVLIEKPVGNGKIILSTDTYFLSNEAMLKARYPDLLAWLAGPNGTIIFDETHFGIIEKPGISFLLRKHRLHWPVAGLLLLAVLFIWKNSSSLVPPDDFSYIKGIPGRGKDYISGFISLLRRNVAAGELIGICYSEWGKTIRINKKYSKDALDKVNSIVEKENRLPAKQRDPVRIYQTIYNFLSKRRHG